MKSIVQSRNKQSKAGKEQLKVPDINLELVVNITISKDQFSVITRTTLAQVVSIKAIV